jgi:heterodisulfide reductase subunit B
MARAKVKKAESRPMPAADEIAYYPGCSSHGTAKEFDMSTRAVAADLGIKLSEPEGWVCCGTSAAHSTSHHTATALPMRNLALVAAEGHDRVTTGCASCYSRFRAAIHDVDRDAELRQAVAKDTGYTYDGEVKVEHLLQTVFEGVGLERVGATVKRPLAGLKLACYYGCLLTRPGDVTGADHVEYPMTMDYLMRAAGAQTLDWNYKTECCGSSLALSESAVALRLSERILADAQAVGADAIVVACPLCQSNLDVRQPRINAAFGKQYDLPVLYFTEVLGLAFGRSPKELGLEKHLVDPEPLLARRGFLAAAGRGG